VRRDEAGVRSEARVRQEDDDLGAGLLQPDLRDREPARGEGERDVLDLQALPFERAVGGVGLVDRQVGQAQGAAVLQAGLAVGGVRHSHRTSRKYWGGWRCRKTSVGRKARAKFVRLADPRILVSLEPVLLVFLCSAGTR